MGTLPCEDGNTDTGDGCDNCTIEQNVAEEMARTNESDVRAY